MICTHSANKCNLLYEQKKSGILQEENGGDRMELERLETLKDSEKSKVCLVFDTENRRMLVEKHLRGELPVYERLAELPHPYLPKLYEVRSGPEETVVVEEYIEGRSIAEAHPTEGQLRKWLLELCEVLRQLHRNQIVHRDIKPSNLLIGADGHIRLIDFDAAREEKSQAESDTRLIGTRGYAPPEQYGFAQTDGRADIYALGITFRELLGKTAKKRRWRHILKRCTALEPKRRYRHAWQITWAVRAAQVRRYVLPPLFAVLAFSIVVLFGFVAWSYTTDTDFQGAWDSAMGMIFRSNRSWVFDDADIPSLKRSQVELAPFTGNEQKVFQELSPFLPEDFVYISTGYCDENGNLLFGGFEYSFSIQDGTLYYRSFQGLYAVSRGGFRYVPPENCAPYAPAVLTLYRMSVFDDRLI